MVNTGMLQALGGMLDGEKPSEMIAAPPSQTTTSPTLTPMQGLIGPGKPQKKKVKGEYDFGPELKSLGGKTLPYDNVPANRLVKDVATQMGVKPELLFSSAWVEGMNKAITEPDKASEGYIMVEDKMGDYPVDGFLNYGLDTFGNNYDKLKKYLPKGFEDRFKTFNGISEGGLKVKTAAFKTNKDALIAKAAFMKMEKDNVDNYLQKSKIDLDEDAKDYFTMAAYNTGFGNAKKMLDEYMAAKDKKAFIEKGLTRFKGVHGNVNKRMKIRGVASELLK